MGKNNRTKSKIDRPPKSNKAESSHTREDEQHQHDEANKTVHSENDQTSKINLSEDLVCCLCEGSHQEEQWFVMCDDCDRHFHFLCVGITEIKEEDPWSCLDCAIQRIKEVNPTTSAGLIPSGASDKETEIDNQTNWASVNKTLEVESQSLLGPSSEKADVSQNPTQLVVPVSVHRQDTTVKESDKIRNSKTLEVEIQSLLRPSSEKADVNQNPTQLVVPVSAHRQVTTVNESDKRRISTSQSKIVNRNSIRFDPRNQWYQGDGTIEIVNSVAQTPNRQPGIDQINNAQAVNRTVDTVDKGTVSYKHNKISSTRIQSEMNFSSKSQQSISKVMTSSSRPRSSASSQCRRSLQRAEDELHLQQRLDEQRVAVRLQAMHLAADIKVKLEELSFQEAREKKYLEQKYKAFSDRSSSVASSSKSTERSSFVSSWIKDQQQRTKTEAHRSDRAERTAEHEENIKRFHEKIDSFGFDVSIPIENEERENILKNGNRAEVIKEDSHPKPSILKKHQSTKGDLKDSMQKGTSHSRPINNEPQNEHFKRSSDPTCSQTTVQVKTSNQPLINVSCQSQPQLSGSAPTWSHTSMQVTNDRQSTYSQSQSTSHLQVPKYATATNTNGQPLMKQRYQSMFPPHASSIYTTNSMPVFDTTTNSNTAMVSSSSFSYNVTPTSRTLSNTHPQPYSAMNAIPPIIESQPECPANYRRIGTHRSSVQQSDVSRILTMNEIASRHTVGKELPKFNGNPLKWLQFIKKFESTNEMCGLSDSENLDRIDKALEEPARTIVASLLMNPECVPEIINILFEKYGRPELIMKATLDEIRKEPTIKPDKLDALSNFGYKVKGVCDTIEKLGLHYYLYNPELVLEVTEKLPFQIRIDWGRHSLNIPVVTLRTLADWLHQLSRVLNRISVPEIAASSDEKKSDKADNSKSGHVNIHSTCKDENTENTDTTSAEKKPKNKNSQCVICSRDCRRLEECPKFLSLNVDEKWKVLLRNKMCRKCLMEHKKCPSTVECGVNGCKFKHHRLLHNEKRHENKQLNSVNQQNSNIASESTESTRTLTGSSNVHLYINLDEMFRIVPVLLHFNNTTIKAFAFLDEGSSFTLIERHVATQLNLKGSPETLCLLWTHDIHRQEETERVNLEISPLDNSSRHSFKSVNIVERLNLPNQSMPVEELKKRYEHLRKVPLTEFENITPTILIGLRHARLTTPLEMIEGNEDEPIATRSRLGWSVHGPLKENSSGLVNIHRVSKCICQERDDEAHRLVKEHFSIENFGVTANSDRMESKENEKALKLLKEGTVRKNSRFETRLLWKNDTYVLPNSYSMAKKRLECIENKGSKVIQTINDSVEDYTSKGYVSKLSPEEAAKTTCRTWYLPLFTVAHPKKPKKLRTVFDAAAKVNGISLNSVLYTGPDLLESIIDVLIRFRENKIAVCGDIKEMFHQILVHEEDKNSQRFLWRNGIKNKEPDVYVMNVMTFGATCSPSAAQYVKNQNAADFQNEYPRAAEAIIKNHYVDDLLDGAETVEDAIKLINDVKFVHSKGGFEIRNFKSNSPEVLEAIGEPVKIDEKISVVEDATLERVLGMFWETMTDSLTFSLKYTKVTNEILSGQKLPTKREILKLLMSIFDPLGMLSYYLVHLKILLQDVWRSKIDWDDPLPEDLKVSWQRWIEILPKVEELKIPRYYLTNLTIPEEKKFELHIFVDASEHAYAAVAYLRIETTSDPVCVLLGSKARVAPLKYLSIPRKELMSSLLGTRLSNSIRKGLTFRISRRVIWSDSITVLTWLNSEHRKYSQFVAHRIGEILETTDLYEWKWVPTKLNVADEATKWSKTPTFNITDRWFTGPEFLKQIESEWPKQPSSIKPNGTSEEMKPCCSHARLILPSIVKAESFSKWERALRAVAFAIRWGKKLLAKIRNSKIPSGPLTSEELLSSEKLLFRQIQWEGFPDEMVTLVKGIKNPNYKKTLEKHSAIYDCSPYLDEFGLLRLFGRVDRSTAMSLDAKRPIILPKDHPLTRLIMLSYHVKYRHRNHETVINELRQRFHIPRIRVAFRSVRWNCALCVIKRSRPKIPQMAELPAVRLEPGVRAFTYIGIDYFGPIMVAIGRRHEKRWGVLITCLTVRAIHIEIACSLNAESCIKALRRFINLRGRPKEIYSDNGTNLVAADKELRTELKNLDVQKFSVPFTSCYTRWIFIPPASPHMGGCWERLIGSVKASMEEALPPRVPTEEDLRSLLCEVMEVVNSRPLTYIPLDTYESEALTPNHFIHGSSNGMKPPGLFNNDGPYLRSGWREIQRCTDIFWKRFIKEYLPTLTRRTKWFEKVRPLEVGDLVFICDGENPRNTYERARVVEVIKGSGSQVRRAKVQLSDGNTLWRPAKKLAVLDVTGSAPTPNDGLDHLDDRNGGENVGASNLNLNIGTSNVPVTPVTSAKENMIRQNVIQSKMVDSRRQTSNNNSK